MTKFLHEFKDVMVPKACSACPFSLNSPPAPHMCSRCKHVKYCNKDCQTKDWPKHKHLCKYIQHAKATRMEQEPTAENLLPLTDLMQDMLTNALLKRPQLKSENFVVVEWTKGDTFSMFVPSRANAGQTAMVMLEDGVCSGKFKPLTELCPGFTEDAILTNGDRRRIVLTRDEFVANDFIDKKAMQCVKNLMRVSPTPICAFVAYLGETEIVVHAGKIADSSVEQ